MELVKQETLEALVKGGENIVKVASGAATELTNEAINIFLVTSALAILKFAVVFVIFFIVKKYCDAMAADYVENKKLFKALKTTALVLSLIFFTTQSFPHVVTICKALVAPKIFLMEKAAEYTKDVTVSK